jgi:hypothetical protein
MRSKMGAVLLLLAAPVAFGTAVYFAYAFSVSGLTVLEFLAKPLGLVGALAALALGMLGTTIYRTDATRLLQADSRSPILYLRSFAEDEKPSPSHRLHSQDNSPVVGGPGCLFAFLIGTVVCLLGPTIIGDAFEVGASGRFFLAIPFYGCIGFVVIAFVLFGIIKWLAPASRLVRGGGVATIEQELALFFGKKGPFIAIGKPGELFALRGASRMYVDDASWQAKVIELMQEARLVVLQIGLTRGTWWEYETYRKLGSPERLLILLAGVMLTEPNLSELRLRLTEELNVRLPPQVRDFSFIAFDQDWEASLYEVCFKPKILWPWSRSALDLQRTLGRALREQYLARSSGRTDAR